MDAAPAGLLDDPELVLCALSMVPIGFAQLVAAAAGAGFDAISVGPPVYRRARRDGLSLDQMRTILDDSGVWVSEVEAAGNWLTPEADKPERWAQRVEDHEFTELAEALGARTLVAVHFGSARPVEEAVAAFGALCDRLVAAGISVALEFPAFARIMDVAGAWDVVAGADRDNGGILLDTWHYYRGNPDPRLLAGVPPERIKGLQLADADAELAGTLEDDVLVRRLPGEGALDLAPLLRQLDAMGVRVPIGIEVWDSELLSAGPDPAARRLRRSLADYLQALGALR